MFSSALEYQEILLRMIHELSSQVEGMLYKVKRVVDLCVILRNSDLVLKVLKLRDDN